MIWINLFVKAQGYKIQKNDPKQDRTSSIQLEKNGRESSGQLTRHINIRYFFIKDRACKYEINVIYCSTEIMVAEYFTKPLQVSLFIKMRKIIMGCSHPSTLLKIIALIR